MKPLKLNCANMLVLLSRQTLMSFKVTKSFCYGIKAPKAAYNTARIASILTLVATNWIHDNYPQASCLHKTLLCMFSVLFLSLKV